MYRLTFSNQTNLFYDANQDNSNSCCSILLSTDAILVRDCNGRNLVGYKYIESTKTWQQSWSERIFSKQGEYPLTRYPWFVANKLLPNVDIVLVKHPDGIRFYQIDSKIPGLKILKEDGNFHDVYNYTLLFGNFYPNKEYVGVMTRDLHRVVKFYAATNDSFLATTYDPLFPLDNELSLTPAWHATGTDFFVTKLCHNDIEVIGLRTITGLEFYQFNDNYLLENIINTQQITKSRTNVHDCIFFADITHQKYQDILHLNESGLFIYQYNNNLQDYKSLHHNIEFTQSHGWLPHFSESIRLMDINNDNRDDLLFTGLQGITALSFDSTSKNWQTLLNSEQLPRSQRYATIIGSLPAMPPTILQPSIFTQDTEGKVYWARVIQEAPITATIAPATSIGTKRAPNVGLTKTFESESVLIPDEIVRSSLFEKPILRWTDQWDHSFLKEPVDIASGQVHLNIPLIDISPLTGWGLQLVLSYDSQDITSDLAGLGWSLPLAQDYIFVDYQGSIYPEDARYYLMVQGSPQLLKLITNENGVQRFHLAKATKEESTVTIEYNLAEQFWIIEGIAEQAIYGKANNAIAQDALYWGLGWNNWRGPGCDKAQQESLITAWYIHSRFNKNNQQALYYYYEIDNSNIKGGKAYNSTIRLQVIKDNQQTQITFDYAAKKESEYTVPNPIDDRGNIMFNIPFIKSHYLQGFSINTAVYSQTLKFNYEVDNGIRLLMDITQKLLSHIEPVLQFNYEHLLEKHVLVSCMLPSRGLKVLFNYETLTYPVRAIAHDNVINYPITEKPKIVYGSDYTIMAYRNLNAVVPGKVIVQIMNREMTQTFADCIVDTSILYSSAGFAIKDYTIQTYSNSFMVFIKSDQKKALYIFNRNNKEDWSTEPTIYSFSNKALVRYSETIISAAEPDKNNIMLFKYSDNRSGWNEKILSIPRAMTFLALDKQVIVGYDDNKLWLFHYDFQTGWQHKALESNLPGLMSMNRKTLASFDLESEMLHQISNALEQNGLQIINNFILLSALQENNGQLFSRIHLFLLDAHYDIIKKEVFNIKRENIYQINRKVETEDGQYVYSLGYIKEAEVYKVRVKNISGKIIESIRNKNIRQDTIDEQKNYLNKDPKFKEYFFLDWNLYPIQISQYGAYCGNDILLRITGAGWEKELLPSKTRSIPLGQNFVLEIENDHESLLKLYKCYNKSKLGEPIKELKLHSPDQVVIRYPAYIAYHSQPNFVEVLTFQDDKTLGHFHTLSNQQLLLDSDWQNLVTIANVSSSTMAHVGQQECKIYPTSTLIRPKPQLFVSQVMSTDGNAQRLIGYQHSFFVNEKELLNSEKVTIIPGNNKNLYGWYEAVQSYYGNSGNVTKTERWFNSSGQEVLKPHNKQSHEQDINADNTLSEYNEGSLLSRSGKWLISDFSPYKLIDEMTVYYGFESYENNQIGANNGNKTWRFNKAEIIKGRFAFTGENYLKLSNSTAASLSFLEGELQPHDQETAYLAACWVRSSEPLNSNKPTHYLKAIINTTNGQEIIGLLAQIKHQIGDWFYLELPIDLQTVKKIYLDYMDYKIANDNSSTILPSPDNVKFKITLRVEAPINEIVELDHIRFSPLTYDFQATIYNPITGKSTAFIQANGLVIRNIYNRFQQEISTTDEEGQLKQFSTSSKTGKLVPVPHGSIVDSKPNILIFEPESGFYETFDLYALRNRWHINNSDAWNIAPGQLWHKQTEKHQIKPNKHLLDSTYAAVRCYFALQNLESSLSFIWQKIGSLEFIRHSNNVTTLVLPNGHIIAPLPSSGELIVMMEENYVWLWLDGVLLLDQELSTSIIKANEYIPWSSFILEVQGEVLLEDMLVMNRPNLKIEYYNSFGEKTQIIQLENAKSFLISETLYDELGREAITTKTTRMNRTANYPQLAYHKDFITNEDYFNLQSVWRTGKLQGKIDRLNSKDQGFAYTRTVYTSDPLNEIAILGLPGQEFSIGGPYATKMNKNSKIAFLDNLFPTNQGYRQKVEQSPNGRYKVTIFDKNNNQVARYVRVPSYNHLLSTYEYDKENRLIKILPPLYHEKVDTAKKIISWQPGEDHLSVQEKLWQQALATYYIYDKYGHLIRKITPDNGITEYLYNSAGQMRFMVFLNLTNQPHRIIYFNYDANGQLDSTGYFDQLLSIKTLQQYLNIQKLPNVRKYQQFDYADDHPDPLLRGRIKYCITHHQNESVIEKLQFNAYQQIVSKNTLFFSSQTDDNQVTELKMKYLNNKIHILTYPVAINGKVLSIAHSYNRLGQLVALGTIDRPDHYASFSYHATGQLASEQYQPSTKYSFTRSYRYNSPGFLDQISDPYLTEEMTYTEKGYGQTGYGDGLIMQTAFNASWPVNADSRWFQVQEHHLNSNYSAICIKALKRTGYLSAFNKPVKLYIRDIETTLPMLCGGETALNIAQIIAKKHTPNYYGHRYAYGNHQELVKAKYFADDNQVYINPLQSDSFAKQIANLTNMQSEHIWQLLIKTDYIITDQQRTDPATAVGKRGKSFFRSSELFNDLLALSSDYTIYAQPIERLIIASISKQQTISLTDFEKDFLFWQGLDHSSSIIIEQQQKIIAQKIGKMLINEGYLPVQSTSFTTSLDKHFTNTLHQYTNVIPQIVQVLSQHFAYSLGETAFDVESYNIDANGNHHLFYTGFNRYELVYHNNSNQIQEIKLNWPTQLKSEQRFTIQHDKQGNVIQALHKGIQSIEYHPVSQRTIKIQLTDGLTLRFCYDAQGERILKRVLNAEGKIIHEIHYLRDEKGRVLIERQTKYLPETTQEIVTAYLHGPRGLLGFFRNNNFYSVTTDHAGSVRLVVEKGKVVAAYDYLPYGQLMRSYGNDPQAHIMYRYTGQEWDEETGLYNYHARLYDPSIGRFYQIDPKAQYFSPYMYAGNSPVSTIDPDGELAFLLICLAVGLIAAELGGAAANNRWNPIDWDFKDPGTYIGAGGGALSGVFLPHLLLVSAGVIGTGATVGLGIGVGYLTTAVANQDFNTTHWKWDRPNTWNALYQGFASGSSLFGGIGLTHQFANTAKALTVLSKVTGISRDFTKVIFLGISYTAAGGIAYKHGVTTNNGNYAIWQWDWTNPATFTSLIDGFDTGMGWPQGFIEISRGLGKLLKRNSHNLLYKNPSKMYRLKTILKNPKHPLYKVTTSVAMAYFIGSSANDELDITRWNLASFSTYEGLLNGIFSGKDASNMLKLARIDKIQQFKALVPIYKNKLKHWAEKFTHMINDLQFYRTKKQYKHLIKQLFSFGKKELVILKQIKNKPESQGVEKFINDGLEKWQQGKTTEPEALKHIISQQAEETVRNSIQTQKLIEWKTEEGELLRKQQEVFPDREVEFLNCYSIAKRKKRGTDILSCVPSTSHAIATDTSQIDKPVSEIFELLFDKDLGISRATMLGAHQEYGYVSIQPKSKINNLGFDSSKPRGFSENFSLILQKTPSNLGPSKPEFFPNFILGSLYTRSAKYFNEKTDIYVKSENIKVPAISGKSNVKQQILKIISKNDDQTLVLKTFIAEEHRLTIRPNADDKKMYHEYYKQMFDLNSRYSKSELDQIAEKLNMKNNYEIKGNIYYIYTDNSLSVKEIPLQQQNEYDYKDTSSGEFHKIEYIKDADFREHLNNLSSDDVKTVESGIKAISQELLKLYNKSKDTFKFNKKSEAALHGFFYGALSLNFKYTYNLDIYVERILGKGYADLILLSRKDENSNKNWQVFPIIMEFKADASTAFTAIDQVIYKGYLYNLGMRTVADNAVIVGVSLNSPDQTIITDTQKIPQPEGLINLLIKNIHDNTKTDEDIRYNIKEELKHLYYSISPLAIKTDNRYLSRLILGQFLSSNDFDQIHVNVAHNTVTTFVFKKEHSDQWIMLNIVENSKKIKNIFKFEDVNLDNIIKLPANKKMNNCIKIDIKVNQNSKLGWSLEQKIRTEEKKIKSNSNDNSNTSDKNEKLSYFFQNIEILKNYDASTLKVCNNYKRLTPFSNENFFYKSRLNHVIWQLAESLDVVKDMVNSESDFQAILHGIFSSKHDQHNIIKVFPEANPSNTGRIDLLISKNTQSSEESENVIIMELKYASGDNGVDRQLEDANNQIFKYLHNLKSFTDHKTIIPITLVFNKNAKTPEIIKYEVHDDEIISHTSNSDLDDIDMAVYDWWLDADDKPLTKKSRIAKRSLDYVKDFKNTSSLNPNNTNGYSLGKDEFYITLNKEKCLDTEKSFNFASSGATSSFQFWPINLVKNVKDIISSIIPTSWASLTSNHNNKILSSEFLLLSDLSRKQQTHNANQEDEPTLLKMGEQWLNNTDINGLLTFGIMLVRKWTGYRPKLFQLVSNDYETNIILDIQATTLLNEFHNTVLKHAQNCGIRSCTSDILEANELHCDIIHIIGKKLAAGELKIIPQFLFQEVVKNNIKKIALKSTRVQANKLLDRLGDDMPNLQQQLLKYEQKWLSFRKHVVEIVDTQVYNGIKQNNAVNLSQAILSTRQSIV